MKPSRPQFITLTVALVLGVALGVVSAYAFTGPEYGAGVGSGAIGVDASGDISVGTTTPNNAARLLIVASSSAPYSFEIMNTASTPVVKVDNSGNITAPSFIGSLNGTLSSGNVSAGTFGSNTGGGNYSFSGNVGIGTTAPQGTLQVTSAAKTYNSVNNEYDSNVEVQGTYSGRTIGTGAALGFIVPANTDGSNPWEQGRILVTPGNTNNGDATGQMYLQVRSNSANGWIWQNDLVLTASGNVGINTTAPAQMLSVAGTIQSTSGGFMFPDGSVQTTAYAGTGQTITAGNVSAGTFGSNTGGGNYSFSGNVGIGTTNPAGPLEIYADNIASATAGDLTLAHPTSGGASSIIFPSTSNYGSDYGYITYNDENTTYAYWGTSTENSALVIGSQNDGMNSVSDVVALRGAAADVFGTNTYPSTMIVNDAGNVGIGTTGPAQKLEVNGNALIDGNLYVSTPGGTWLSGKTGTNGITAATAQTASAYTPVLRQTTASGNVVALGGLGDGFGFLTYNSARTANGYDYAPWWVNTANGDVGIGTTAPVTGLSVAGEVTANEGESFNGNGGYSFIGDGGYDTGMFSPSDGVIDFFNNTNHSININAGGAATFYQGATFNSTLTASGMIYANGSVALSPGAELDYWGGGTPYRTWMDNNSTYFYGAVQDYAEHFTMDAEDSGRGWTWGAYGSAPGASLDVNGNLTLRGGLTANGTINTGTLCLSGVCETSWSGVAAATFTHSFSTSGYEKLPDGLIMQWGYNYPGGGCVTSYYPIAFPNAALNAEASTYLSTDRITYISAYTASYITVCNNGSGSDANWFVIGY